MLIGKGSLIGAGKPDRASVVSTRVVGSSIVFLFNREVVVNEKGNTPDTQLNFGELKASKVVQDAPDAIRVDFTHLVPDNLAYSFLRQPNWCDTPLQTPVHGVVS
jgi:hypothetical protein